MTGGSPSFRKLPGLVDELQQLLAVTGRVARDRGREQFDDSGIAKVSSRGRVTQEHAEAGDRGGKLEVIGGPAVVEALVHDAALDLRALIALRWLVSQADHE